MPIRKTKRFIFCEQKILYQRPCRSAIPIRNTNRLNFGGKTYNKLTSSKHFGGLGTLAGDVV
jgi:hypothetical protein